MIGGIKKSGKKAESLKFSSIGKVAEEFGFTPRALRFYEEKGLVSPIRVGNRRLFSPADRRRINIIAQAKRSGLSLDDIREILRAEASADLHRYIEIALERYLARAAEIDAHRQELNEMQQETQLRIDELKAQLAKNK